MAVMRMFMKIEKIPGSSLDKDHKDWCDIRGVSHQMEYVFDKATNQGANMPVIGDITVIKPIDKASPNLYEYLCKMKKVDKVQFEFWRDKPGGGGWEKYFLITITDCRVSRCKPFTREAWDHKSASDLAIFSQIRPGGPGATAPQVDLPPHLEEAGFSFRQIEWTWLDGNVKTLFDLAQPNK